LVYTMEEYERIKAGNLRFYKNIQNETVWVYPSER